MNATGKIVLYFIAVLFIAALLAPPLYWAGNALIPALREEEFQKFFNRAALVAALGLLWPLAKSLRINNVAELGIDPNPRWLRDLLVGIFAAVGLMILLCVVIKYFDGFNWHDEKGRKLGDFPKVIFTAASVGVIEELLFRGAFLGVFLRTMGKWRALFISSAIYSILHFIKPDEIAIARSDVHWHSGFGLLPAVFTQFGDPMLLLAGFTTLLAVGWVLGYVTIATRSLWMAIGLHAGWVLCIQGFGKIAKLGKNQLPWIGSELKIGIAPLITVILTGLVCWLVVRKKANDETKAG